MRPNEVLYTNISFSLLIYNRNTLNDPTYLVGLNDKQKMKKLAYFCGAR